MKFAKYTAMNYPGYTDPDPTPIGALVGLAALLFGGGVLVGATVEARAQRRREEEKREAEAKKYRERIERLLLESIAARTYRPKDLVRK